MCFFCLRCVLVLRSLFLGLFGGDGADLYVEQCVFWTKPPKGRYFDVIVAGTRGCREGFDETFRRAIAVDGRTAHGTGKAQRAENAILCVASPFWLFLAHVCVCVFNCFSLLYFACFSLGTIYSLCSDLLYQYSVCIYMHSCEVHIMYTVVLVYISCKFLRGNASSKCRYLSVSNRLRGWPCRDHGTPPSTCQRLERNKKSAHVLRSK